MSKLVLKSPLRWIHDRALMKLTAGVQVFIADIRAGIFVLTGDDQDAGTVGSVFRPLISLASASEEPSETKSIAYNTDP